MGYYEQLDEEIDHEMGWADQIKKDRRNHPAKPSLLATLSHLLHQIRLPKPLAKIAAFTTRLLAKTLLFPIISPLSYSKSFNLDGDMLVVKRSWKWRIIDALLTRLILTPVILGIFLLGVVYATTHPERVHASITPESFGAYYKSVRLVTTDGQGLTAWYVPPVTADEMSLNPEASLTQKWPAAVLCHGLGASQDQYLPLAQELHNAGFAVLLVDLRGQGESDPAAVTYGLRENLDVLAGVKYLGELPNINPEKICVVGHDIAALASLEATALNSSIAAVVADGMWPRFEDRSKNIFTHPAPQAGPLPTSWLAPLYDLTFQIAIRDRLSQLAPEAIAREIHRQPVLFIARQGPNYAPVPDVMSLAASVGAHHEILIADDSTTLHAVDRQITTFLTQSTHWKNPKAQTAEEIQRLLDKRVK